ncbi:MAG: DNA recombination protein RmuC [Neisseria sp.]
MNESTLILIAATVAAALLSILITWLLLKNKHQTAMQAEHDARRDETSMLQTELAERSQQHQFATQQHIQTKDELYELMHRFEHSQTALSEAQALSRQLPSLQDELARHRHAHQELQVDSQNLHSQIATAREQINNFHTREQERHQLLLDYKQLQQDLTDTQIRHQHLHTQVEQERQSHQEKIELLNEARQGLSDQFKNLANTIFEEKSKKFTEHNALSINQLLNPLNERMTQFSHLVQTTYEKEAKERLTLENELKRLQSLNNQLHTDAKALTDALIGTRNKSQGNWGEMILEKVLENSGLTKGREYIVQAAGIQTTEDGSTRRLQPDVLVNLPDNKQIIIDAKMSLTAYVRYTQAQTPEDAERELSAHTSSVRQHIKSLSDKQYSDIEGLITLDFVFMFIPVEPAYLLALQQDNNLFQECFDRRIMLVGPSTLLATLRTVAHLWRNEQQNQNALQIADEGGKLYDKFVGFVTTLESVGKNIEQAQTQYTTAFKQLSEGRGNLVNRAEKLRNLGIKTSKQLNRNLAENAEDNTPQLGEADTSE